MLPSASPGFAFPAHSMIHRSHAPCGPARRQCASRWRACRRLPSRARETVRVCARISLRALLNRRSESTSRARRRKVGRRVRLVEDARRRVERAPRPGLLGRSAVPLLRRRQRQRGYDRELYGVLATGAMRECGGDGGAEKLVHRARRAAGWQARLGRSLPVVACMCAVRRPCQART
jgi:hypothetical protein